MSKNPFIFRNGQVAHTYNELLDLCKQFPEEACHHLFERHFEAWFQYMNAPDTTWLLEACYFMYRRFRFNNYTTAREAIDLFILVYNRYRKEPFIFRNGQVAHTYEQLLDLCKQYPEDAFYHLCEGHFESWLIYTSYRHSNIFVNACKEIRNRKTKKTVQEHIKDFIAMCTITEYESDGQNWVAGWD